MARHPNKEIQKALEYAEQQGWTIIKSSKGHCWGMIRCGGGRGGCQKSIWSTPRSPQDHAKDIRRLVNKCPHQTSANGQDEDA